MVREAVEPAKKRLAHQQSRSAIIDSLGFLAHELNTPLGAAANYTNGIVRKTRGMLASDHDMAAIACAAFGAYQNTVYSQNVLSTYIDAIHGAGPTLASHSRSTAKELVNILLETYPLKPNQRSFIHTDFQEDFSVHTFPNSVALVLSSIMTNALRAVEGVSDPEVSLMVLVDGSPKILVIDNGPGISSDVQEQLSVDPITTPTTGGWGLIFCNRVMQSFGGSMVIYSSPGRTQIALEFPAFKNRVY